MKVLHVISDENIGGAGVLLTTLLRNLDRARVESVVALPKNSLLRGRIEALRIPVRPLTHPCSRLSPASMRELVQVVREETVDLVHTNASLAGRAAGRLCGIPVIHTRHCCYPVTGALRLPILSLMGRTCNRLLSDHSIATAEAAADNLRALGIPADRITCIINGSDPVRQVEEWELDRARARYGLSDTDFVVGICARLTPCKGHGTFLRAARKVLLRVKSPAVKFLIVGTGELMEELLRESERLGIADAVRFTGFVEDMAPIYRLLRINVNCSCGTETSCLAISEGMSASLPTVASNYGGNPSMLGAVRGESVTRVGFLFPVGDADALADDICRIILHPELEMRLRHAALERYRTHYTAAQMSEHLAAVYESVYRNRR
ncbi:MAG: glycosyltransferase [Clostridia bacterium]|nr:glycosyltransferase [Clostridia bacterium]